MKSKKAVSVGYYFGVVPEDETEYIKLKSTGTCVYIDGKYLNLYNGETYEDSRKIDSLLDRYGEYQISDYEIEPVIMSGELEFLYPDFDQDIDSIIFGAYSFGFSIDERIIPVDFDGMGWNISCDGDKVNISFASGRTPLSVHTFIDDIYEEDYRKMGLSMQDITAKFLASASSINEFNVFIDPSDHLEEEMTLTELNGFRLKELKFSNGTDEYAIGRSVLDKYNESVMCFDEFVAAVSTDSSLSEIEKFRKISYRLLDEQEEGRSGLPEIVDEVSGVSIVCPWLDCTGRFDVEPVEEYGKEAFDEFCDDMRKMMNFALENSIHHPHLDDVIRSSMDIGKDRNGDGSLSEKNEREK